MLRHLILCLPVALSVVYQPASSTLPTFSPNNQQICKDHGYNWAAEIRCLRDVINDLLAVNSSERSRGSRSLTNRAPLPVPLPDVPQNTSPVLPYSYMRSYGRPYYKHSLTSIPKPSIISPIPVAQCKCDGLDKLEARLEKKLYEVKMRAQYESEEKVRDLEKRFESEFREYQRITTKDIIDVKRKIDYVQAPRTMDNDNLFFYIDKEESWYSASEHCIGYGARLASVHSQVENALISSLIPKNTTVWIGVNDVQKENIFRNNDGTPVDFFKWAPKQPNNEEHNENCVEMDENGRWNDKLCLILRPYVCKKGREI